MPLFRGVLCTLCRWGCAWLVLTDTHNPTPTYPYHRPHTPGVALAKEKLTAPAGFLTPASALGDLLIERLQRRKIEFKLDG